MSESAFAHEVLRSLHQAHYHVIPIEDEGKANPTLQYGGSFRAQAKPYDAIAGKAGLTLAIEFKQVKRGLNFPFSKVQDHQFEGLKQAHRVGWCACVLVNFRIRPTADERARLNIQDFAVDRAYLFPYTWIKRAKRKASMHSVTIDMPELSRFRIAPDPHDAELWNVPDIEHIVTFERDSGWPLW